MHTQRGILLVGPTALLLAALRSTGCGRAVEPLHHDPRLDEAARRRAQGGYLHEALVHSGYLASSSAGLHATGPERAMREALRASGCGMLANPEFRGVGYYSRGKEAWIVLAAPCRLPSAASGAALAARTLALVNEARARGASCGNHPMPPAPPLHASAVLSAARGSGGRVARQPGALREPHGCALHRDGDCLRCGSRR